MTADPMQRTSTLLVAVLVIGSWFLLGIVGGLATIAVVVWTRWSHPSREQILAAAGLAFLATAIGWLAAGTPDPFQVASFTNLGGRGWLDGLARAGLGLLVGALLVPVEAEGRPSGSPVARDGPRLPEVDRLRAIAIVTVVFIHGLPFKPPVTDAVDYWLSDITRFSVATLVFVSGWLLPREPVNGGWVWHRLRRLVPAYLLASVVMITLSRLTPVIDERPLLQTLLLGDAVGPYYYVFVLVVLIAVTPALQRLTPRLQWTLLGVSAAGAVLIELADLSLYAHNHLPLTWLPHYLAGYLLRPFRPALGRLADHVQAASVVVAGAVLVGVGVIGVETAPRRLMTVLGMWAVLAMLLVLTVTAEDATTRLTRTLSARSYLIYLYHPPIVAGLAGVFGSSIVTGRPVTATLVAVIVLLAAGGLAVVAFPRHAQRWLGA